MNSYVFYMSMRRLYVTITAFFDGENKSQDILPESLLIVFNYLCAYGWDAFIFP